MSALNGSEEAHQEQVLGLGDSLEIIQRRWPLILGPLAIALGIAVGLFLIVPPVYRATATVTIDRGLRLGVLDKLGDVSVFAEQSAQAPDVETVIELARSGAVRREASARLTARVGDSAQAVRDLHVQQVRNSDVVSLSVEHADRRIAAAAANALAEALMEMSLTDRRRPVTEAREFIATQLARETERLRASEDALVGFKDRHGDVALAEVTALNIQKLADLEAQQVDLRLKREEIRAQITRARAKLSLQTRIAPTQWTPSPLIASLQRDLATLEIELSGLRREFTPKHPAVISAQARIEETGRRLNVELARSLQARQYGVDPVYQELTQELARAEVAGAAMDAREHALTRAIAQYETEVRSVPAREVELARLTRTAREAEKTYLLLSDKLQDARIAEASIGSAIRIVDRAQVPSRPVKPRLITHLLLALVLGAMVGAAGVFVSEQLDDTVKSAEEVERLMRAPVLGGLPVMDRREVRNRRHGTAAPRLIGLDGASSAAEALRLLRTHVLLASSASARCLLVTSALPREGKSTIAANLALAIARATRHVWLVNGDLRHPTLGTVFLRSPSPGLEHFLTSDADAADVMGPTFEPYLAYTDSGVPVDNAAELWTGPRGGRLIADGRRRADIVLIDSPPLLTVTDAELIGRQADGCLLVVRLGATTRRALMQVRQRLDRAGIAVIGVVLNFVPRARGRGSYFTFDAHVKPNGKSAEVVIGKTEALVYRDGALARHSVLSRGSTSGRDVFLAAFLFVALAAAAMEPEWIGETFTPRLNAVITHLTRIVTDVKMGLSSFLDRQSAIEGSDRQGR
jgi:capsular exopolysaccharide synthesis family protein